MTTSNIPTPADLARAQKTRQAEERALTLSIERLARLAREGRLNNIRISDSQKGK